MKSYYLILFFSFCTIGFSQSFVFKDSIAVANQSFKMIDTDLNNSLYLISETKIEKRFQNKASKIIDFKNVITSIDATNPLRMYIYSNFNKLSILDEDLNPIQDPITIKSSDYIPTALKVIDNQFCWFYDMLANKLIYFNYQLQKAIVISRQVYLKNNDQAIEKIHSYKNYVYLKGEQTIYVYDDYGNFKYNFELATQNQPYYFYKNVLFYIQDNQLIKVDLTTKESVTLFPLRFIKSIAFNETNFYAYTGNQVYVYSVN